MMNDINDIQGLKPRLYSIAASRQASALKKGECLTVFRVSDN